MPRSRACGRVCGLGGLSSILMVATVAKKIWGGVFSEATDRRVEQFTESISFDWRLYEQDIAASIAHAQMLAAVELITADECRQLCQTLEQIRAEIEQGKFPFCTELEDIHSHVERALVERLGPLGGKIHTARSRNDQVATDLRLWVRAGIDTIDAALAELQRAFVARCDADAEVILPAYTHLRRAQPVLAAHYWLAYCEKFQRDRQRLQDCRKRTNVLPLGSAALAGTSLPIDRQMVAQSLGFAEVSANSLDATSDRDFAIEFVFCLAMIALHLSNWAEEWIIWSSTEFDFLQLPEAFCTGSSIMPQKINPDVLELIRGKTARVAGDLQTLLMLIKGLPLAYNRDLQEDKPALLDAFDTVSACLQVAAPLVEKTRLKRQAIEEKLERGYLDATNLMEHLIGRGIPQRTAHEMVGRLVREAMQRGVALRELALEAFRAQEPSLGEEVYDVLGAERAVASARSYGSTNPALVKQQIALWKQRLGIVSPESTP